MLELNSAELKERMASDPLPIVAEYWAGWCMPCKIFAPVMEEVAGQLAGKATFCKVNLDENMDLAQEYIIETIPTVIIYKNGKVAGRFTGITPKEEVLSTIEPLL